MALTEAEKQLILFKKGLKTPKVQTDGNSIAMRLEPDFSKLDKLFSDLLKEIRNFKPTINIPEIVIPNINIPEIRLPDQPVPKVIRVETERVVEVIKDSIKVEGLDKQITKLLEGLAGLRNEGIQSELLGTYNKEKAVKTAIVNDVLVNGDFGQYQETTGAIKKARVDSDGHQQVDVLTMPSITIPPVTIDPTGLATDSNQTSGDAKTQIVDSLGNVVTVTGNKLDVNASIDTTGLATSNNQTDGSQRTVLVDGSNTPLTTTGSVLNVLADLGSVGTDITSLESQQTDGSAKTQVVDALNVNVDFATETTLGSIDTKLGGTGKLQIVDAGGEVATVTSGKLDVNASIDTTGLALASNQQTDALTDTELRATPVAVSGTIELGATSLAALEDISVTIPGTVDLGTVSLTALETITVNATDLDVRPLVNTDVVTAELSAVDNAVLDTIAAKDFATQTTLAAINTKLVTGTDIGDVTINNSTGASAVNIQDGGNTITVDGTVSANATLSAETTKVIGTVNIAASQTVGLAAGTAGIGKLTANSGVDIGDVDVTSLPALAAGTNAIGKLIPPDYDVTSHTAKAQKYYTNAGAVTDGIIWSPAAGKRWHIVSMYIQTSADATVTLEDDLAGGDSPVLKGEFAAKSGAVYNFSEMYPLASGEDAADLIVTTSAGNIYITITGFEI